MPRIDANQPIMVDGTDGWSWREGQSSVVVVNDAVITQGVFRGKGSRAVLWIDASPMLSETPSRVTVYLEGDVKIDYGRAAGDRERADRAVQTIEDRTWFGRLSSLGSIHMRAPISERGHRDPPAVYGRARQAWDVANGTIQLAQFTTEPLPSPGPVPVQTGRKKIQVGSRSNALIHIKSFPGSLSDQSVTVFTNGIRAVIEGIQSERLGNLGRIVIETDRLVLWSPTLKTLSPSGSEAASNDRVPIEVYLEGNIVFRQGDRLIYADRMYYNATSEFGVVLSAEMFTPVAKFQGMVRLKADVLQQLNDQLFEAYGGAITTSRMGVPSYWMQGQQIKFQDVTEPRTNPLSGQIEIDPETGQAAVDHDMMATSENNFVYVEGVPVMYWPALSTNLRKPSFYVNGLSIKSDGVLGTQVLVDWDLYQLFHIDDPPDATDWTLSTDYLSERGMALGTTYQYQRPSMAGFPGPATGWFDAWGLYDDGLDDLGRGRQGVTHPNARGRVYWRHRQDLPQGFQFTAQLGLASDRNFVEEFFEKEWDQRKDQVTSLQLKKTFEDQSLRLMGQARLNSFYTQSDWFPRLDHFLIGRSFLQDHLTWYAHSQASYARLRTASAPTDPVEVPRWGSLPWEEDREGVRAVTRQEVNLPLQMGWFKLVPYAGGELGYWGEVLGGDRGVSRAAGKAGVRASLPIWKADPTVQNLLFNLSGLAHKATLQADLHWADVSQDLSRFPLYDPIDDDSEERFRRFLGGAPAAVYDERNYLFRSGIQEWIASPTTEVADDRLAARLGVHQRWQTKRGLPGQQRVLDWITLDLEGTVFPHADRDNLGETLGQLEHYFRWHVGDRLTVLSDGYTDMFNGGLKRYTLGMAVSRPGRGRLYSGIASLQGPFNSTLLISTLTYRMSEKWITDFSTVYDLGPTGSIGESLSFTRIGEAALVRVGFYADHARSNVGVRFQIEPRFLPNGRLGRIAAGLVPVPGTEGID